MLAEAKAFLTRHFQKPENGLMQIILIHGLIFVSLLLIKILLILAGYEARYQALYQSLSLPASWQTFLYRPWSIFTHFWIQEYFWNTFWSLLLLNAFGRLIMNSLGSPHLVALYVLGGIAGGSAFLLLYNLSPTFRGTNPNLVGTTGSLYAVMAGAAVIAPHLTLRMPFIGPIPIRYIVAGLLLLSFLELSSRRPAIAIANLGGALLGYGYVQYLSRLRKLSSFLASWYKLLMKQSAHKVTDKPEPANSTKAVAYPASQEDVDAILEKIAASGYESLTQEERQQLFHAGQ
ncbi:MAG: rhomboid family intramembrane serine protease [Bacteroidota bacterium]